MAWYHGVVEREHDLQNPTSRDKIRLLGERLRLDPRSRVLDVASGHSGPAIVLATSFGCRITCVERAPEFHEMARTRVYESGVDDLIELVQADARAFPFAEGGYDAVLCLGASFVWGALEATLTAISPAVRDGGGVAIGEPYWRSWPLPDGFEPNPDEGFTTLAETIARIRALNLEPTALIDSSLDDWDRYESLHWSAADRWLRESAPDGDAAAIRVRVEQERDRYLRWGRDLIGWAIVAARIRDPN